MGKYVAKDYFREWKKKNPEKIAEYARRYQKKHPETVKKAKLTYRKKHLKKLRKKERIYASKRRKADPEGAKRRTAAYKARQEAKLWEIAGSPRAKQCKICDEIGVTVFDHCHKSGHFRGWICDRCNRVLGSIKDDVSLLQRMISYLGNFYERTKEGNRETF